jgi:transcriptional regulator with XRE-family HTH domain
MGIGEEIRRRREEQGLTGFQLAVKAGMAPSAVSQIETGKRTPSSASVVKLADALGVEVGELYPKAQVPLPFDRDEQMDEQRGSQEPAPSSSPWEWLPRFERWRARNEAALTFLRGRVAALGEGRTPDPDRRAWGALILMAARRIIDSTGDHVVADVTLSDELDAVLELIDSDQDMDEGLRRAAEAIMRQMAESLAMREEVLRALEGTPGDENPELTVDVSIPDEHLNTKWAMKLLADAA